MWEIHRCKILSLTSLASSFQKGAQKWISQLKPRNDDTHKILRFTQNNYRVILNSLHFHFSLSTDIFHQCFSTNNLTKYNHSPKLVVSVFELSSCRNLSQIFSKFSLLIQIPLSFTINSFLFNIIFIEEIMQLLYFEKFKNFIDNKILHPANSVINAYGGCENIMLKELEL